MGMAKKSSSLNRTVKAGQSKRKVSRRPVKVKQAEANPNTKKKVTRLNTDKNAAQANLKRQLKIQKALYEIADAASAARDMQSFYKKLHKILGKLMYAENFFIALYN